jgi:hypothetical protein
MAYSIEQQHSRDIDWYFKDGNGNLIHVASAGGQLPKVIEENDELMDIIHSQIIELPTQFEESINPNLVQFISFRTTEARELYIEDFVKMARRGLISIDKTILGNFEDTTYHIVAYKKNTIEDNIFHNIYDRFISTEKIIDVDNPNPFNLFELF